MNTTNRLLFIVALLFLFGCATAPQEPTDSRRPNILIILIDDLGWKDLSSYGSDFYETPHIDQLVQSSSKFTQAYSPSPICSPARAALLTGKTPGRLKLTDWIGPERWHPNGELLENASFRNHLPSDETTMAEAFQEAGYSTYFLGKWHLGNKPNYPEHHGFDLNIAGYEAGAPPSYFYPYYKEEWEPTSWGAQLPDLRPDGKPGEYLTDRLTEETLSLLEKSSKTKEPFFLLLSHYAVHRPLEAPESDIQPYREKAKAREASSKFLVSRSNGLVTRIVQSNPVYAGMIRSVDRSVKRITEKLRATGLKENTIVIFASDNGARSVAQDKHVSEPDDLSSSHRPLRKGKGWLYEAGIRVPLAIHWPKHDTRSTIYEPVMLTDLYPTLLDMAGLPLRSEQHRDGSNLVPLLRGKKNELKRDRLFWHYPHYHIFGETPVSAVRSGPYKLIKHYEQNRLELFNLEKDIGERNDLSEEKPEKVKQLHTTLKNHLRDVDANLPVRK